MKITLRIYTDQPHDLFAVICAAALKGFKNNVNGERFEFADNRLIFIADNGLHLSKVVNFILKKRPNLKAQVYFGYGNFLDISEAENDLIQSF